MKNLRDQLYSFVLIVNTVQYTEAFFFKRVNLKLYSFY